MNLLTIALISGLNLYFLKDSPLLLVRIIPDEQSQQLTLYYSFNRTKWDSTVTKFCTTYFEAVITPPDTINTVGFYFKYNQKIDNNKDALYLYELKQSPRMILPLSLDYLEIVLKQARKKIMSRAHIDEAITIIDYVDKIIYSVPYVVGSEQELKINIIAGEVKELRQMVDK